MNPFFQTGAEIHNQFQGDSLLQAYLRWRLQEVADTVWKDLDRLGERAAGDLLRYSVEAENSPPEHIPFDPWGRRIDEIRVSDAWKKLERAAAEEGIVATGYERKFGEHSRSVQFAKLYLYHASSAFFSCPLAMTDGAARALELYGDEKMKASAFKHLTSRDPKQFWTSGQWMTERTGGSDVSGTSTIAKPMGDGRYALHGTKWFSSATTAQMAMTLARIEGSPEGSRGLSLFYVEVRNEKTGKLNNIEVHRLKDKLGTNALPTAEISLQGTPAQLVGGEGSGVKKIASLFNITRIYNSVCALSATRRAIALAVDYSKKRVAFGKNIIEHPLHAETLASLQVEFTGNFLLTFHLANLLGKEEVGKASEAEMAILRLLTPIAKLYTAKSCHSITSEMVEVFGGAGYVEDTGIPKWLRDSQVFSIWEGTTNVLSLDVLRAMEKENAFPPFVKDIQARLTHVSHPDLQESAKKTKAACEKLTNFLSLMVKEGADFSSASARSFAFSLARTFSASLLLEFAQMHKEPSYIETAKRWCIQDLAPLLSADAEHRKKTSEILASL